MDSPRISLPAMDTAGMGMVTVSDIKVQPDQNKISSNSRITFRYASEASEQATEQQIHINDQSSRMQYSMAGILHFLQTEWARFEMDRAQWDVEKAELQARIAFLQGERKGQENLKQDLVRRIKMLEFALKQERQKYHKLKFGTDLNQGDMNPPNYENEDKDESITEDFLNQQNSNLSWKQGRQLLRQYLQEIGYSDTIIDVRSARVRQLLGIQSLEKADRHLMNGEAGGKRLNDGRILPKKVSAVDKVLKETEKSVMQTFDFLNEQYDVEEEENLSDGEEEMAVDEDDVIDRKRKKAGNESMAGSDMTDPEAAVMSEFDFLAEQGEGAGEAVEEPDEWNMNQQMLSKLTEQYKKERGKKTKFRPLKSSDGGARRAPDLRTMLDNLGADSEDQSASGSKSPRSIDPNGPDLDDGEFDRSGSSKVSAFDEEVLDNALGLGDLAGLTVNNDADVPYDITSAQEALRKTWAAKYTLRSHFDGIRALAFHPVDAVLLTGSEDHTLKLWNLQKTVQAKKTASLDVEPVYTFRGHDGPVLSLVLTSNGETCFSGGADTTIRHWTVPNSNIDPYDTFDPAVILDPLEGHTNAVWGLAIHPSLPRLISCSADGSVRIWDINGDVETPLLNTLSLSEEEGRPTSLAFMGTDPNHIVTSYTSSSAFVFDLETGQQVLALDSSNPDIHVANQINCIITHPTLPLTITAHEDRQIRFFDNNTGKMVHSMVAHLDAVTSLAVDPNGLYLLSGSHDCSIRLWNLDNRTCVQEITAHRKKFDESIHAVAFHPAKSYLASAGADALAKVFV